MSEVSRLAAAGRPVLGICNGFQVLCEAGLLPGRTGGQPGPAVHLPAGHTFGWSRPPACSPASRAVGDVLRLPLNSYEGNFIASAGTLAELDGDNGCCSGTATGRGGHPRGVKPERLHRRRSPGWQCRRQRGRADAAPERASEATARVDRRGCAARVVRPGAPGASPLRLPPPHRDHAVTDPAVAEPPHRQLGMTDEEHDRVVEVLGRPPRPAELAMFSVMWSEHCSYKSSRAWLGRLPDRGPVGRGRTRERTPAWSTSATAGWRRCGSRATTTPRRWSPTRARPPAWAASCATSSRWAPGRWRCGTRSGSARSTDARNRYLLDGVVRGIAGYGNAVGVPTLGGEIELDDCYSANPLVNVMALGLLRRDQLVLSAASGEGNMAVLLGSLHGARRHRRRLDPGVGGLRRGRRARSDRRCRSATLRGEEADRGLPRAVPAGAGGRDPGSRCRRDLLRHRRVGRQRAGWGWTSTSTPCPCARRA